MKSLRNIAEPRVSRRAMGLQQLLYADDAEVDLDLDLIGLALLQDHARAELRVR